MTLSAFRWLIVPARVCRWILVPLWFATCSAAAIAQSDRVYTLDGDSVSGAVINIARDGVQLKRGSNTQAILAGDISKIMFEGDPSELTTAREFVIDGQFEQASEELKKMDFGSIKRPEVQADAAYYIALARGKLALAGRGPRDAAASAVNQFLRKYSSSYHFFDATELLGDLALAMGKSEDAAKYYGYLGQSRSADLKVRSVYLAAIAKARQGQHDAAIADLEKVIGASASTPTMARLQTLAKAAKAEAMAAKGEGQAAVKVTDDLIAELNPTDVDINGKIYNARGAGFTAAGDTMGAITAYLHTHLMFSSDPPTHAEAIKQLVGLWESSGRTDRAAEMRSLLKQLYPGY